MMRVWETYLKSPPHVRAGEITRIIARDNPYLYV